MINFHDNFRQKILLNSTMAAPSSTETREILSCACTCAPYWPEEELNGESSFHPEKVTNLKKIMI